MKTPEDFNRYATGKLPGYLGVVIREVAPEAIRAEGARATRD